MDSRAIFHGIKRFIRTLQRSDDIVKKRWMVGISSLAMVCVIAGWIIYQRATLAPSFAAQNGGAEIARESAGLDEKKGVLETFSDGARKISRDFSGGWQQLQETTEKKIKTLTEQVEKTNTITIDEIQERSTPTPEEPLPTSTLP